MLATMRAIAIACLLFGGCSFATVRTKPPCSRVPPYVDTVVAVVAAAASLSLLSSHPTDNGAGQVIGEAAAFGVGSALFTTSAIYGYVKSGSCVDVR